MPNIYWSKNALAGIGPSGQNNFDDAREAAESNSSLTTDNTTSSSATVSQFQRSSGRGSASFGFKRSYWGFNFDGYTTGDITNLKFNFKPSTNSTSTLSNRFVEFTGFGNSLNDNYSEDEWWDGIENLTAYSNAFNSNDSSTAQAISLLSQATTDAQADGFLKVALLNSTDYNGINIAVDVFNSTVWNVGNNTTGNVYLSFDYAAPGFGKDVNNVAAANIVKINNVASADIVELNGVPA